MKSDAVLKRWFRTYNRKFFDNRLPADTVVCYAEPGDGNLARCAIGMCYPESKEIYLDVILRDTKLYTVARFTLLHEMAHLDLPRCNHGKKFQAKMMHLAALGAFRCLW